MTKTTKYAPGSPWQLIAELRGAASITNERGEHVPYHDLMAKAADALERAEQVAEQAIKRLRVVKP